MVVVEPQRYSGHGALRAVFELHMSGVDVSEKVNKYLVSLSVKDLAGGVADICTITLSDNYGELAMPSLGSPIEIALGWEHGDVQIVFVGVVDTIKSIGSRDGRFLLITGTGAPQTSILKQPQEAHADNATLQAAADKFGGGAGISVFAHPSIGSIKRDWWGINGESFMAWGQRIASEVGSTFKIMGNKAVMLPRAGGSTAGGQAVGGVTAKVGDNLISWDISPQIGRPVHGSFGTKFFDMVKTDWLTEFVQATGLSALLGGAVKGINKFPAADKESAQNESSAASAEATRNAGKGRCTIIGNPEARSQATCTVIGARDGIDATYQIDSVDHRFDRSGGYISVLELVQPDGGGWDLEGEGKTGSVDTPIPNVPGFPG